MLGSHSDLDTLAGAVADGTDVDWADAESGAPDETGRQVIRQLRHLANVATLGRATTPTWGPLQIRSEIGRGAFGTVYRAWDSRLEREVALKLLHAGPGRASTTSLIREGRLLAQIRHPNVVTVYGADEHDGRVGLWMEFVTGRTLKEIVNEHGPFGAPEAGVIGLDLCRALAAVHRLGFVHRDVKAQNVLREVGGRTVLMDFGAGSSIAEETNALRGTPAYLAPELLEGEPPSVRSDLYALGVLLYYLVAGSFPVTGGSLPELRTRHAAGSRTPLQDLRPELPARFIRVVDMCTAPDAADRPQSAGQVESLLESALGLRSGDAAVAAPDPVTTNRRWLFRGGIALVGVILTGLGVAMWGGAESQGAVMRRESVAILPFKSLPATGEDEYFSEGITADVIANLSSLRNLRVIAGPSTAKFKDRRLTPVEIGGELGVDTVLDGSIRQAGDRVRIVTMLMDARTGEQIWSSSFDRELADIVAMKSDVAHRIAVALQGELSQQDMALLNPGRQYDYVAYNLYLRGRHYWGLRTEDAVNRSVRYFHDALGRDPKFAPAYAGLADAYTFLGAYGAIPREEAYARAAEAAERAVALDETLAEAHASLGLARKNQFRWAEAEQSLRRAIELKPGSAAARQWYSVFLTQHGRFPEAIAEIKIAMSLDPLSVAPVLQFASLLTMARRYDDALAQYERGLAMDSRFATASRHMALTSIYKGRYDQAETLFDQARALSPPGTEDQELKAGLGYLYAVTGRTEEALKLASDLTRRYTEAGEAVMTSVAAIYAGLGRNSEALEWLERARDVRDPEMGYLLVAPLWEPLRREKRFRDLLTSLGFSVKD